MISTKIALIACLFASSAAVAQVVPAVPAPAPVPEKKICRSEVPLGSIMAKRICHTKREWVALHAKNGAEAERTLDNMHQRGNQGLAPGL